MPNTQCDPTAEVVLLVDADRDARDLYGTFLQHRGCRIEQAEDGPEALAKALAAPPDVIVTEVRLPGFDGIALCQLLRNDPATASVPIVVLTTDARSTLHEAAYQAGATSVLVKPCVPDQLWHSLQDIPDEPAVQRPAVEERLARTSARDHHRYVTTTPPLPPPRLHCQQCDTILTYYRSHVGGVTAKFAEQWDYYHCPRGCGDFQYRHRTRKLTRSAA